MASVCGATAPSELRQAWALISDQPLASGVALGRWVNNSEPQFSFL